MQPFEDVNKRVSRLAANISLIRMNLCPLSFVDVPERTSIDGIAGIYELNRVNLHEGDISRDRLRPSDFPAWRETWR